MIDNAYIGSDYDEATRDALEIYRTLKAKSKADPAALDSIDRFLLLASACVTYIEHTKEYDAMMKDARRWVETRMRLAGGLIDLFERGQYTGDEFMEDVLHMIPDGTDEALLKLGQIDLALRVTRLIHRAVKLDMAALDEKYPDGSFFPFPIEVLEAEKQILIARGQSAADPGFEHEARRRAILKVMMGSEQFEESERRRENR